MLQIGQWYFPMCVQCVSEHENLDTDWESGTFTSGITGDPTVDSVSLTVLVSQISFVDLSSSSCCASSSSDMALSTTIHSSD